MTAARRDSYVEWLLIYLNGQMQVSLLLLVEMSVESCVLGPKSRRHSPCGHVPCVI